MVRHGPARLLTNARREHSHWNGVGRIRNETQALCTASLLDTRSGIGRPGTSRVSPGGTVVLDVTGAGGLPTAGVAAVVLNVTVTGTSAQDEPFWWFNVRPSNTEPLLRLNVEAGGELALNLRDLYTYISLRLTQANLRNDHQALDECTQLIQPVREAWLAIKPAASAQAAQGGMEVKA